MTLHDPTARTFAVSTDRFALPLFAAALFSSALLLFAVQPISPRWCCHLGARRRCVGRDGVLSGALLAGYAYAHLLARTLPVGRARSCISRACGRGLTLPIGIAAGFGAPPSHGIGLWLVGLFAASIGLPFVALAASAPLLQSWFAISATTRRIPVRPLCGVEPRFVAALLAYPLAIESLLTLRGKPGSGPSASRCSHC